MTKFPLIKKYVAYLRARPGVSFYEYLLGQAWGKGPAPGAAVNKRRGWRPLTSEEAEHIRETGELPEGATDAFIPI